MLYDTIQEDIGPYCSPLFSKSYTWQTNNNQLKNITNPPMTSENPEGQQYSLHTVQPW